MTQETVLAQIDIGGNSDQARAAVMSLADSYDQLQAKLNAIKDAASSGVGLNELQTAVAGMTPSVAAMNAELVNQAATELEESQAAETATKAKLDQDSAQKTAGSSAQQLTSTIKGLSGAIQPLAGDAGALVGQIGNLSTSLAGVGAASEVSIGALAGVGAAAAAVFAVLGTAGATWSNQLLQLSAATGLSVDKTNLYVNALGDVGANSRSLIMLGTQLTSTIETAAQAMDNGTQMTARAKALTQELGIAIKDQNGNLRDSGTIFEETIQKLGTMADRTQANGIAAQIFGRYVGAQLLPLLDNYNAVMGTASEQSARQADQVAKAQQAALDYDKAMQNLKVTVDELGSQVLPAFTAALKLADDLIGPFASAVGTAFDVGTGAANKFAGAVGSLPDPVKLAGNAVMDTTAAMNGNFRPAVEDVGKALGLFGGSADNAAASTDNLASSEQQATSATQQFASALADLKSQAADFNKSLSDAFGTFDKLMSAPTPELLAAQDSLAQTKDLIDQLTPAYNAEKDAIDASKASIDSQVQSLNSQKDALSSASDALDSQIRSLQDQKSAIQAATQAWDDNYNAQKQAQSLAADEATAQKQIYDITHKNYGAMTQDQRDQIKAIQDKMAAEEADAAHQKELKQRQADAAALDPQIKSLQDQKQAISDQEKAISAHVQALQNDSRELDINTTWIGKQMDAAKKQEQTYQNQVSSIDDHRKALQADFELQAGYQGQLEGWVQDESQWITNFETMATDLLNLLARLPSTLPGQPLMSGPAAPNGPAFPSVQPPAAARNLPGRASGGPVFPGTAYRVGEGGPEMFVPDTAGHVVSSSSYGDTNHNNQRTLQVFGSFTVINNAPASKQDAVSKLLLRF